MLEDSGLIHAFLSGGATRPIAPRWHYLNGVRYIPATRGRRSCSKSHDAPYAPSTAISSAFASCLMVKDVIVGLASSVCNHCWLFEHG
mmetsp:Transcript_29457/g.90298  ORF Transcript_29457/g.90298 Transcript_29457/m.90298 type:complete len:88 (+) Transcript_29457:197-460(+)